MNEQLQKLKSELEQYEQQSPRNQSKIDAINAEIARIEQDQKQQQKEHEERMSQSLSGYDEYLEKMSFGGMSLRQAVGETIYQLLSIDLKKFNASMAENFSKQINDLHGGYKDQLRAASEREEQLQRQNSALQQTVDQQEKELQEERLVRAQAEQYRDNASAQLEEAKKEVAQLKEWNDRLHKEAAFGVKGEMNVIDMTEEEERQKKALEDQLKRERTIYGLQWTDDIRKNRYKAKLAATDEEIEFNWTEKTKYTVIEEYEVGPFRTEYTESECNHANPTLDANQHLQISAPEIVSEWQFQPGDANHNQPAAWGDGSPEAPPIEGSVQDTEDISGPASRAELKALEERVAALENSIAQRAA